ncbi:hypothetical protein [Aliivibrio fischeri]|uniref:Uncharacterized protein n=1 Tax=Aliivibrio fischeri SR5 TaxID=1088719 RepID=A0AAV3ENH5_ALIFS|nr:hypothetical protein [Aliivibrio fischeri]EHN68428.1 hypothetical protein VFSR5_A1013 [Aliivibrio fischeri SR5]
MNIKNLTKEDLKIFSFLINDKGMDISEAIKLISIEIYFLSYKDRKTIRKIDNLLTPKNGMDIVLNKKRKEYLNSLINNHKL